VLSRPLLRITGCRLAEGTTKKTNKYIRIAAVNTHASTEGHEPHVLTCDGGSEALKSCFVHQPEQITHVHLPRIFLMNTDKFM
jgi:hypothetical protein